MNKYIKRPWSVWLLYFALLLWVAMPQGLQTALETYRCQEGTPTGCVQGVITPLSTNADIIRLFTTADAAFMANHAREYVEHKDWMHVTGWPYWPPGMLIIETFLYWLSPVVPVGLVLIVLSAGLWAGVMTQANLLFRISGLFCSFLLPLFLLLTPEFSYFFHRGLFYTESLSIGAFLLGIGLLVHATLERNTKTAILAGCALMFSAYMRAQTDMVMTVASVLFFICWFVIAWRQKAPITLALFKTTLRNCAWLGALSIALLTYHALTLPYRAAHGMQWVDMAESPVWPPTWEYKKDIIPLLQFYSDGGGVEGCEADPKRCAEIHEQIAQKGDTVFSSRDYFHFTIASVLTHPLNWTVVKYPYLRDFWLEVPGEGVLLAVLFPVLLLYGLRKKGDMDALFIFCLISTLIGIMVPLLLTHFESRYLYQFKLLIFYIALLVIGRHIVHMRRD